MSGKDDTIYFFTYRPIPRLLLSLVGILVGLTFFGHGIRDRSPAEFLGGVAIIAASLVVMAASLLWLWRWFCGYFDGTRWRDIGMVGIALAAVLLVLILLALRP